MQNPIASKTKFSEIYPRCYKTLVPIIWILFMVYCIMCTVFDLYYCLAHGHLQGMIWLYTCGNLVMGLACCMNFLPYSPPSDKSIDDDPTMYWSYIIWFITCFVGKIVTIVIFTLNEQGKINIGLNPDAFIISCINWLVSSSPGTGPIVLAWVIFAVTCPFIFTYDIWKAYNPSEQTIPKCKEQYVTEQLSVYDISGLENSFPQLELDEGISVTEV
jgi:hypothetical protein